MGTRRFTKNYPIAHSAQEVYEWHFLPGNFLRGFPPWENVAILRSEHRSPRDLKFFLRFDWDGHVSDYIFYITAHDAARTIRLKAENPKRLRLELKTVITESDNGCKICERVEYQVHAPWYSVERRKNLLEQRLKSYFVYKHEVLSKDLETNKKVPKSRILISGGSGLIGSALDPYLQSQGHDVYQLVRTKEDASFEKNTIFFNPKLRASQVNDLEGFDTIIHLMGRSIATRWTPKVKETLIQSRVNTTQYLTNLIMGLKSPPKTFMVASASGVYGDHGSDMVTEHAQHQGSSFLRHLVEQWEKASEPLKRRGVRVIPLRFAPVLSSRAGFLKAMIDSFRYHIHGLQGQEQIYLSWCAIDDVVNAIHHIHCTDSIKGPTNMCSPYPVTYTEFYSILQKHLHSSYGVKLPKLLAKLLLGQAAEELSYQSIRMQPQNLVKHGYHFRYAHLKDAVHHLVFKNKGLR